MVSDDAVPAASAQATTRDVRSSPLDGEGKETVLAFAEQALTVRVPRAWAFSIQSARGAWGYAKSAQSGDELWVFHQPARRTIALAECETIAGGNLQRLRHGLKATTEHPWSPLPGYAGTLRIVLLSSGATLVEGYAVGVSRCLSAAFEVNTGQAYAGRLKHVVLAVFAQFDLLGHVVTEVPPQF